MMLTFNEIMNLHLKKQLKGLFNNISNEHYHSLNDVSISKTGLDYIEKSPLHYKEYLERKTDTKSEALKFGSMIHEALLEPENFSKHYKIYPDEFLKIQDTGTVTLKPNRKERLAFEKGNPSVTYLKPQEYEQVSTMLEKIWTHKSASLLLDDTTKEVSAFTSLGDVFCRARPDAVSSKGIMIDLKTTGSASPKDFYQSMKKYRYHVQAAFYLDVYNKAIGDTDESKSYLKRYADSFVIIAIEKTPPYELCCFTIGEQTLNEGRIIYKENLKVYRECLKTNRWPGYSDDIITISKPDWMDL